MAEAADRKPFKRREKREREREREERREEREREREREELPFSSLSFLSLTSDKQGQSPRRSNALLAYNVAEMKGTCLYQIPN